ncbi:carbohydrate kinase [Colwelliaceae bacterium 6471]
MLTLLSYGEALIDFLPADNALNSYYPMAGGAPANVAVAYAKLGGNSYFAGGISEDNFGDFLLGQLEHEKVNTKYVERIANANTAVVLVSLDDNGERSFNFYRHQSADTKYQATDIDNIDWQSIDIFHYCSNTLTSERMFDNTVYAINKASANHTLISFDVNLRLQLWDNVAQLVTRVTQAIRHSDLIKLSREEAEYLAGAMNMDYAQFTAHLLAIGPKLLLVSNGEGDVHAISRTFLLLLPVPRVTVVDTTAAGDSFIGGFLFSLSQQSQALSVGTALTNEQIITEAVMFAVKCGAHTCQQKGAFAALPDNNMFTF